jgi:hypothetical protein
MTPVHSTNASDIINLVKGISVAPGGAPLNANSDLENELLQLHTKITATGSINPFSQNSVNADITTCKNQMNAMKLKFPLHTDDELLALRMYTCNSIYKGINTTLDSNNYNILSCMKNFLSCMVSGLARIPPSCGTVYRGAINPDTNIAVGSNVTLPAFSSSSTNKNVAIGFQKGTLYVIDACTPRAIKELSAYQSEEERLFGPMSVFKVTQIIDPNPPQTNYKTIHLKEFENPTMLKTVLWVDDVPNNNDNVVKEARTKGIIIKQLPTTVDALNYLNNHKTLISRSLTGFRVITDMRRTENGVYIQDAGAKFIKELRNIGYNQKVLIYTSSAGKQFAQANGLINVVATESTSDAMKFGNFQD